jgi:rod shape-determining protein MreD
MSWTKVPVPILSVVLLTLISALPWGLPADDRFFLPLLPAAAVYMWTLNGKGWLPEWAVFAAGLMLDILSQGPLGYWALIYLLAHLMATMTSESALTSKLGRVGVLVSALVGLAAIAWAVGSLYFFEVLDWTPYATGAIFAAVVAMALAPLFDLYDTARGADRNISLTRG